MINQAQLFSTPIPYRSPCTPVEVPDVRAILMTKWATPGWRIAEANSAKNVLALGSLWLNSEVISQTCQAHIETLAGAELYWVGADMCDLLYQSLGQVPNDTKPEYLEWPARTGLIVFSKSFKGVDANDAEHEVSVDAIHWTRSIARVQETGEVVEALHIMAYRCIDFGDGLDGKELQLASQMDVFDDAHKTLARGQNGQIVSNLTGKAWMPLGRSTWAIGEELEQPLLVANSHPLESKIIVGKENLEGHPITDSEITLETYVKNHGGQLPTMVVDNLVNLELSQEEFEGAIPGTVIVEREQWEQAQAELAYAISAVEDRRFVSALFTLLNSHSIAQIDETHVPRHIARRLEREAPKGAPRPEPPTVRVVYLRRPESHGDGEGEHHSSYSHRWVVSAHWRNQPYGPGRSQRKLIMIPSHVKGPSGAPIVVKQTVKALVR